jgi:hypothetical protein
MRRYFLSLQGRLGGCGSGRVSGEAPFDCVAAHRRPGPAGEQGVARVPGLLGEPGGEDLGGVRGERGYPLFPALSRAGDVGPGAEEDVSPGEGGELGDPQAGLDGEREQRAVAPSGPGGGVRGGEQRGGFGLGEVGDELAVEPLGRDGRDPLDDGRVVEVTQGREAEQGMDRGQAGVAGTDAVAALVFEMVQERADQRGVEVGDLQAGGLFPGLAGGEVQEQPERGRRRRCAGWPCAAWSGSR